MVQLKQLPAYQQLAHHHSEMAHVHMRELFGQDPERYAKMHLRVGPILLDYAKNRVNATTMALLFDLVRARGLKERRAAMFAGEKINTTEDRAVLHTALRRPKDDQVVLDGRNVVPDIHATLQQMRAFTEQVRSGAWLGFGGKRITHIVNLGIGGSDLGPVMASEALKPYHHPAMQAFFVSNVDGSDLSQVLAKCPAAQTLFIVASKTFTTQETMANAQSAKAWFLQAGGSEKDVAKHFVALSTNTKAVQAFGIDPANMFAFWDWVGGRYSVWSAIGMAVALMVGMDNFDAMRAGAHEMDVHFCTAPMEANMPIILAVLGFWYGQFFAAHSHAVLPYAQLLHRFPAYLQQADMESNGKSTDLEGARVEGSTGPILWGEPGTNGQHAFFQLLHQGTHLVPADFIACKRSPHPLGEHHLLLLANCLAQSEALMRGQTAEEAHATMVAANVDGKTLARVLPHKVFPGNRPTNTLLLDSLEPRSLGALVALYEHKIFVQGVLWQINSFDQWGVELGKQLAQAIVPQLRDPRVRHPHDSSTQGLIDELARA